jgi:2-keto-4-pentenoate hydratase/2-oxohepta-3-ene-1,7-dioic acid hydratase in catechol pathway
LFTKFPSSVIGPDDVVRLPETDGLDADWEVELAVVIGSVVHPGEPGDLSAVFGYTIANDITSRYFAGAERQFLRAKSCDGFCPLGPVIVTRDEIPDPQNLQLRLFLNRERQQDGNSANMIFGVVELIQAISETVTLEPGDIILTGTPPGTGMEKTPQRYLRPGDVVLCEIAGIGVLSNLIVNHAGRAK